jgi:hypothetical protein
VDLEAHVACVKTDCGFWFGGAVVEELRDGLGFGLAVFRSSQGTKCYKHGGVDCTCVVQKSADNFLCSCHLGRFQGVGCV